MAKRKAPDQLDLVRAAAHFHSAAALEEAAAAELAPHLEGRLRETLQCALRIARQARRPTQLRCADIAVALDSLRRQDDLVNEGVAAEANRGATVANHAGAAGTTSVAATVARHGKTAGAADEGVAVAKKGGATVPTRSTACTGKGEVATAAASRSPDITKKDGAPNGTSIWQRILPRCQAVLGGRGMTPLQAIAAQELPKPPKDFTLHVRQPASGCLPAGPPRQHHPTAAGRAGVTPSMFAPSNSLLAEQKALLKRIADVLQIGYVGRHHWPALLRLLEEPHLASLRPELASIVRQQAISLCTQDATTVRAGELHILVAILEMIALGPFGAEDYVDHCLMAAVKICLFQTHSAGSNTGLTRNPSGVCCGDSHEYVGVKRRAANFIAALVRLHAAESPGLPPQIAATFKTALLKKPHASVAVGAVLALAAMGHTCVAEVLVPLVQAGGLDYLQNAAGDVPYAVHRAAMVARNSQVWPILVQAAADLHEGDPAAMMWSLATGSGDRAALL